MKKPEGILADPQWVHDHLKDPKVRVVEVDYDPAVNYDVGHVPGALLLDWRKDLNDPVRRDIFSKEQCERVLSRARIFNDSLVILYGDYNNWFAAYAFWALKYYGFEDVRLMDGGRKKWIDEGRPLTKEIPDYPLGNFKASGPDKKIRAYVDYVKDSIKKKGTVLVDVRSPDEFTGKVLAPPEYSEEHAQRGGHVPNAVNVPWELATHKDGAYRPLGELKQLYTSKGVAPDKEVIVYCRIGERAAHTWFALKYLLGYPDVKIYDGSWAEWGNMIGNPIEKP